MLWIYWIVAIVVFSLISSILKSIVGIKSYSLFTPEGFVELIIFLFDLIIVYIFFIAIKGKWLF